MNALLWAVFAVLIVAVVGGIVGAVYVMRRARSDNSKAFNGAAVFVVALIAAASVAALLVVLNRA